MTPGIWRPVPGLGVVAGLGTDGAPTVYVAPLPDGPPYVLAGAVALVWAHLPADEAALTDALAAEAPEDLDLDDVRAVVADTLRDLAALGLIGR